MDKVVAQDRIIPNVLDYCKAARYIDSILGYSQQDCNGKYFGISSDNLKEYQNFWHYLIDRYQVKNDSYLNHFSFVDLYKQTRNSYGDKNWRTKVARVWADEYPDEYTLWFNW